MCDFMSYIKKDGKLYFLRDDDILSKWGKDCDIRDHIGHSAIEEFYPESRGGEHIESATKLPVEISNEINKGHMDLMAKAGGWHGARYSNTGKLNSPWWVKVEKFIKEVKKIKYLDNHGAINPEWLVFETMAAAGDTAMDAAWDAARDAARAAARAAAWDAARAAACDAARDAAGDTAMDAARDAARDAAWDAARAAALLARCVIAGFADDNEHMIHAKKRLDVWRAGYGLLCDVNGVLYVYKKI